jgi:hypothetical protein
MSGYEVEHNIKEEPKSTDKPRRPDLSTFFSTLELVDTSGEHTPHHNVNALPEPASVAAAHRTLANAFLAMSQDGSANELLESMIQQLVQNADYPPEKVEGVPDGFLDDLDRVNKDKLEEKDCPICNNPFLDGKTSNFPWHQTYHLITNIP